MRKSIYKAIAALLLLSTSVWADENGEVTPPKADEVNLENVLYLDVIYGRIAIELLDDVAPKHVERIKTLTREGFYDGLLFHRVMEGFMAQTGDPLGTGAGGSDLPDLKSEFNDTVHVRGVVSMARSDYPHSANSQFFIVLDDSPHLNGKYTAWGRVISGMKYVDKIEKGDRGNNGSVEYPDRILKARIAADVAQVEMQSN